MTKELLATIIGESTVESEQGATLKVERVGLTPYARALLRVHSFGIADLEPSTQSDKSALRDTRIESAAE